ncbi:TPA: geranylgeranylglyceryl/heptaprenylglyceryl phosphate synthase [Flavobacterium psychrophilum]|uniref:geranylgeranylglyceryl/heptaprenylglyceryl phosphate synthase n=1 Tax=Flavobacterium psychrophilum TaxID=96345 RepID=UPI00073EB1CB|nr:geranylgeranylglyceryl/heptaprenylglyceryl phosphate synthase [Flavobacterium psychrophilum]SNB96032.1 Geranylgeranylglyceryl phosphate synthase [Flavobacterium psychrophilum]GAQ49078.1 geranylgeranylglyceryl/heptaprenylglyceryl phosphate synthase [Flavobacterium psychrophilum]GAW89730.1 geranylgeranylglyceryl/heptaprenylglyceryl phosphate synthase [Flavobacterium psychrophilum]GEJ29547.1 geranylgeranylglyceryl phosphate synthase [Flavobacterium psychrophilum]GEJ33581.1 geranylgeranylglycer
MSTIYNQILKAKAENKKLLAILLDPDKIDLENIQQLIEKINQSPATHIFVGGSLVENNILDQLLSEIKKICALPIVLFPGNPSQISDKADAILFLSLISGRNSDYLIEHQVNAVPILNKTNLEIISTGYILIESGSETAVALVSKTKPLPRNKPEYILQTAQAGEMLGKKLIYLEAGSGAKISVSKEIIALVSQNINIPLIVGGGIRNLSDIKKAHNTGADLVVIGTAFENNSNFFNQNL